MIRVSNDFDLEKLLNYGFEESETKPVYIHESKTKNGKYYFIFVDKETRQITGSIVGKRIVKINEEKLYKICKNSFLNEFVIKE